MKKLSVMCLFGGNSTEYEVSCRSFNSVIRNVDEEKFDIIKIGIDKSGAWYIYNGDNANIANLEWINDSENLHPCSLMPKSKAGDKAYLMNTRTFERIEIDVILPVIHGANGEDGSIQGLAKLYELPCAGANISGSACAFDKGITKMLCNYAGINQGKFVIFRKYEFDADCEKIIRNAEENIKYPMFVKPANAGSSVGITKAKTRDELMHGIAEAFKHDSKAVIEEFMSGKEIEVAVVGNGGELTVSCCGEIDPCAEFYDYDTKYINDTAKYFIPARLSEKTSEEVRETAKKVYMLLGIDGFSRVDFFVNEDNIIYFNEINTIPGFTEISMFAKLMIHGGTQYKELVTKIIELAL